MAEASRDLLRDMLAGASNMSDLADALDFYGFSEPRIRAAIAADDAELARLRRIEDAARAVDDALGSLLRAGCSIVAHNAPPEVGDAIVGALASLSVALLPPTMRQLGEADAAANEGEHG